MLIKLIFVFCILAIIIMGCTATTPCVCPDCPQTDVIFFIEPGIPISVDQGFFNLDKKGANWDSPEEYQI
jgi:hypothetical protein